MSTDQGKTSNSPERRLVRIESRLTNLGRWLGYDLTVKPDENSELNLVAIEDGVIHASSNSRIGDVLLKLYRHQKLNNINQKTSLIVNGRKVAVFNAVPADDELNDFES